MIEEAPPEIKSMPMWVSLQNVLHTMYTWKGLSFLASPVENQRSCIKIHSFVKIEEAKVFIEVDLSKELPKQYRFKSANGIDAMIVYKYPLLPPRCATCSKWGHPKKFVS